MIEIRVGGTPLDMKPGVKIRLSLVSPLFADDIGFNSQSLSFSLPNTNRNRELLGRPEILADAAPVIDIEVQVFLFGLHFRNAKLRINTSAPQLDFSVALLIDVAAFVASIKDRDLRSWEFGGVRQITTAFGSARATAMVAHGNTTLVGTVDTYDYVFHTVSNRKYVVPRDDVPTTSTGLGQYINEYQALDPQVGGGSLPVHSLLSNYPPNAAIDGGTFNRRGISPMIYLGYVFRHVIEAEGYEIDADDSYWSDDELKTITLFNNHLLDDVTLEDVNGTDVPVNMWLGEISIPNHLPNISTTDYFLAFLQTFQMRLFEENGVISFKAKKEIIADKSQIDWRNKVASYLNTHEKSEGCLIQRELDGSDENQSSPYLVDEKPTIGGEVDIVDDLPDLSFIESGVIYWVKETNELYKFKRNKLEDPGAPLYIWEFYSYYNFEIAHGAGLKDCPIGSASVEVFEVENYWKIADFRMTAESEFWEFEGSDFGIHYMFYRGLVDRGNGPYPTATPDDEDGTWNYSLWLHGERGLYNVWWKDWLDALSDSRVLKVKLMLNAYDVLNVDFSKKHRIRTHEGEMLGFFMKIDVEIGENGIGLCEGEFMPINIE